MAKTEITLAQAKKIAGRVGARIAEDKADPSGRRLAVTISGRAFKDLDGNGVPTVFYVQSPLEAAHAAVIHTGQYCHALLEVCKKTYVDEQAFWQNEFHSEDKS